MTRTRALTLAAVAVVWLGLQVTAPSRSNPRVDEAAALAAASTPAPVMTVLKRSCYDCHSSETRWPWYASVAPMSWLVTHDVIEARGQLNFSKWMGYNPYDRADMLDKVCENVTKRKMPLWQYRMVHRDAVLSDAEIAAVCAWTEAEAAKLVG